MNVYIISYKIELLFKFFLMTHNIATILSDTIDVVNMHEMNHFQINLFSAEVEC